MDGGREGIRTPDPLLAKQVLSQLSYTPTEELILILKHFPVFCPSLFMFLGLNRAFTVHLFVDRAHWTVTVHIRSPITGCAPEKPQQGLILGGRSGRSSTETVRKPASL